jgi:hypothetical protein
MTNLFTGLLYICGLPTLRDEMMVIFMIFGLFVCYWRSYSISVSFSNTPRWRNKFINEADRTGTLYRHSLPALFTGTSTGTHLPAPELALQLRLTEFRVFRKTVILVTSGISRWLDEELKIKWLFPHVMNTYALASKHLNTLLTCRRSNPTNWTDSVWVNFSVIYSWLVLIRSLREKHACLGCYASCCV